MYRKALAVTLLGFSATILADGGATVTAPPQASATPDEKVSQNQPVSGCLRDTGTHLRTKPGDCLSSPGRSYGSDEMRSTGASNNADALRLMDPSLTTTR